MVSHKYTETTKLTTLITELPKWPLDSFGRIPAKATSLDFPRVRGGLYFNRYKIVNQRRINISSLTMEFVIYKRIIYKRSG